MFLEISQKWQENTCARVSFLIKLEASACSFIKKRLWHRCFPVNFAKFLRTSFLQNTSGWLLLTFLVLPSFRVALFSCFIYFVLHFFLNALFSCCTFFVFFVVLFSFLHYQTFQPMEFLKSGGLLSKLSCLDSDSENFGFCKF